MTNSQELMDLLSKLAQAIFEHSGDIVSRMRSSEMAAAEGLEFGSIPEDLLPARVKVLRQSAEDTVGSEIELELLRITGLVVPHYHKQCSCVVIRCDTEPDAAMVGQFDECAGKDDWAPIRIGQLIEIPAGRIHGMKTDLPVHFISVNSPAFDPSDVLVA